MEVSKKKLKSGYYWVYLRYDTPSVHEYSWEVCYYDRERDEWIAANDDPLPVAPEAMLKVNPKKLSPPSS